MLSKTLDTWKKVSESVLKDYEFFSVRSRKFYNNTTRKTGEFYVISQHDGVQVAAETTDGNLVLVEQFRFGTEHTSIEMPGGRIEEGEDIIVAAQRELLEETGYTGESPEIIGVLDSNSALHTNKIYLVKIKNCQKTAPTHFDEFEDVASFEVSPAHLRTMLSSGAIKNTVAVATIGLYLLH